MSMANGDFFREVQIEEELLFIEYISFHLIAEIQGQ